MMVLRESWLSAGAVMAGCPESARMASPGAGIVSVAGRAGGRFKSIGIADRYHGILLVGQVAVVTQRLLGSKSLSAVPVHLVVGGGDLYLVDTTQGTFALVRRETANREWGEESEAWAPRSGSPANRNDYVVLLPGLTRMWVRTMSQNEGWLWPVRSWSRTTSQGLSLVNQDSVVVGHASCDEKRESCELSMGRDHFVARNVGPEVSADRILRYAPGL
jgi:hypothetical protein